LAPKNNLNSSRRQISFSQKKSTSANAEVDLISHASLVESVCISVTSSLSKASNLENQLFQKLKSSGDSKPRLLSANFRASSRGLPGNKYFS